MENESEFEEEGEWMNLVIYCPKCGKYSAVVNPDYIQQKQCLCDFCGIISYSGSYRKFLNKEN